MGFKYSLYCRQCRVYCRTPEGFNETKHFGKHSCGTTMYLDHNSLEKLKEELCLSPREIGNDGDVVLIKAGRP